MNRDFRTVAQSIRPSGRSLVLPFRRGPSIRSTFLSQLGFYLFLAKVTIHLMRPEPANVVRK